MIDPFKNYPRESLDSRLPMWTRDFMMNAFVRSDGLRVVPSRSPWGWLVEGKEVILTAQDFDGGTLGLLQLVDQRWPAPLPPILAGQVWAASDGEFTVIATARVGDEVVAIVPQPDDQGNPVLASVKASAFSSLVLVRGDWAPWTPPGFVGWEDEDQEGGETP